MKAEIVGMVRDEPVAVTSDGRVWFGHSYTPEEAEAVIRYLSEAVDRARSSPDTESPTDPGKFL